MRVIKVGCFGGGTGLPSVLGGLKRNPWLDCNAVVTMFDSGGSSGQLRDELGVLPPGDVLKCALALARNEREARRRAAVAAADARGLAAGRPHRRQPAAVDDGAVQRQLPRGGRRAAGAARVRGRVWPVSIEQASAVRATTPTGARRAAKSKSTRGRAAATSIDADLARAAGADPSGASPAPSRDLDAVIIGPGSFYTSLMPIFAVNGVREALAAMRRSGRPGRQPADRRARHDGLHGGRCGAPARARRSAGPSTRSSSTTATLAPRCWSGMRPSTSSRSNWAICRRPAGW